MIRGLILVLIVAGLVVVTAGQVSSLTIFASFTDTGTGEVSVGAKSDFGTDTTAEAGGPYAVDEDSSIQLDGSGSTTTKGNIDSYSWQITSGPGSLSGNTTVTPTYNAPGDIGSDTTVTVELTVTTNKGGTETDTGTISVRDVPGAPSVDTLTVTSTGGGLGIDANVSDPTTEDDSLATVDVVVVRTQNGKPAYENPDITVSGDNDSVSVTTGRLPGNNEQYRVDVTVYDTNGDSGSASDTETTG